MVRKQVFTRDDVVTAGVAVVARDGMAALSARRVADELGASTAPVYSNFANMEELGVAVRLAVAAEILAFTDRHFSDNAFLNMGLGVLEYARQNPGLYGAVFVQDGGECEAGPALMGRLSGRMASLEGLAELPEGERVLLLHQMGIFTHGLAVRLVTGLAADTDFDDLKLFLEDAGAAMVAHAKARPVRTDKQEALIRRLLRSNKKDGDSEN